MNFSTQHQRKTISSLVGSLLKGTALGVGMAMLAIVPSIPSLLAQPDSGNSNNSITPPALPGVEPSPAVNPSPGTSQFPTVNPSPGANQPRPIDRNTLNPPYLPQPSPSFPTNDVLPSPMNDNNGIPGAEIDRNLDNRVPNSFNNQPNSNNNQSNSGNQPNFNNQSNSNDQPYCNNQLNGRLASPTNELLLPCSNNSNRRNSVNSPNNRANGQNSN